MCFNRRETDIETETEIQTDRQTDRHADTGSGKTEKNNRQAYSYTVMRICLKCPDGSINTFHNQGCAISKRTNIVLFESVTFRTGIIFT